MRKLVCIILICMIAALVIFVLIKLNNKSNQRANTSASVATSEADISSELSTTTTGESAMTTNTYTSIGMDEAEEIFKAPGDYIILDVRREDEFAEGHIPGAINVRNEDINTTTPPEELPDLNQVIYVYCRSGRRSKEAAQKLVELGYTNIIEFGGIIDWNGEVVE